MEIDVKNEIRKASAPSYHGMMLFMKFIGRPMLWFMPDTLPLMCWVATVIAPIWLFMECMLAVIAPTRASIDWMLESIDTMRRSMSLMAS